MALKFFRGRTFALWMTAMALGVAVALLSWHWRYAWLPPGVWEDVAVAAGLYPPASTFPLVWHTLVRQLFQWVDMAHAIRILQIAGHCALGLAAMLVFAILNETLPMGLRGRILSRAWCRRIIRLLLVQGALLFVLSDPIWEVGQVFGPTTLNLLMLLFAILVFVRYAWNRGIIRGWYWTMLLCGIMAGDTLLGAVLVVLVLVVCRLRAESNADKLVNPMADPFIRTMTMRRMTIVAMAGWLSVIVGNVVFFCLSDGLEAHDLSGGMCAITYLMNYWKIFTSAASPSGWMLFVIVVLVPLVLSMAHIRVATDDDRFLPYWYAAFFVLVGAVSFLQIAGWRSFWFWTWTSGQEAVKSPLLRCVAAFVSTQTFTYALCVLGVEVYFRNYRRIAGIKYQDSVEETVRGAELATSFRRFSRLMRFSMLLEPVVLFACVLPYRMQNTVRGIVRALYDCARQTAYECQDAQFLFTDGTLDTAVELASREQGRDVLALSLTGGNSERDRFIRQRGALDKEDSEMLSFSAMDALRTWLRYKKPRMETVAVQLGFELWAIGRKSPPPVAGLVARPAGFPPGFAEAGAKEARVLARRILDVYNADEELEDAPPGMRDIFTRMQWRVARMCRVRSDRLDKERLTRQAMEESDLADKLDAKNAEFQRVRQQLEMVSRGDSRLTPREGLKLGMDRGDFRMAEMFARQVLFSDPDDLAANFVMGMFYFGNEQYSRAEAYLKKCAQKQPKAAPIFNNLAVAQLRQGNLEEAEKNARRALEIDADSFEARRTLKNVLKEKEAAEQKRRENPTLPDGPKM